MGVNLFQYKTFYLATPYAKLKLIFDLLIHFASALVIFLLYKL